MARIRTGNCHCGAVEFTFTGAGPFAKNIPVEDGESPRTVESL